MKLTKAFEGFDQPIYLTNAGDGSKRIFVVEKKGLIKVIENGKILDDPFLDITDRVGSKETERGLLSIAFHPQYTRNRRVIVYYTNKDGDVIVSEFTAKEKNIADNTKEKVIIKIEQPAANHNGGHLAFGPDRNLYISVGDGGSSGDPWNNAQNLENMLGKMLRINVNSRLTEYAIPYLNPFLRTKTANSKIWSYGLRNPWRFSIDAKTGDIFIADVGENQREEINFQPSDSEGGENYGWNYLEGLNKFKMPGNVDIRTLNLPVLDYGRDKGCSVTGGYVYRGEKFKDLDGTYIFSDFCSGIIFGLKKNDDSWEFTEFLDTEYAVSSFGVDEDNEIYLIDFKSGAIFNIETES